MSTWIVNVVFVILAALIVEFAAIGMSAVALVWWRSYRARRQAPASIERRAGGRRVLRAVSLAVLLSGAAIGTNRLVVLAEDCAPVTCQAWDIWDWEYWWFGCERPPCPIVIST